MDSPLGAIGTLEFLFIVLLTFVVVGPRRVIRGWGVILEWIKNGFRRPRKKAPKSGRNFMRGLGRMTAYFTRDRDAEEQIHD